jgi:hypothetical protein
VSRNSVTSSSKQKIVWHMKKQRNYRSKKSTYFMLKGRGLRAWAEDKEAVTGTQDTPK